MGTIQLITGGMRSGKSSFGEKQLEEMSSILYIATGFVSDEEMKARVKAHQERRGERYTTYEGHKNLDDVIMKSGQSSIMLECVGTLITNRIFDLHKDVEHLSTQEIRELEKTIMDEIKSIIKAMKKGDKHNVIITNEVGLALVSEYKLGRIFTDILGRANQYMALEADSVIMMVSGLPLRLKA